MNHPEERLRRIAARFALDGAIERIEGIGHGLINDTFRISCRGRYLLQRLNTHVFPHPAQVMENIARVCRHLAGKPGDSLELIPTLDGADALVTDDGQWWRIYRYIEYSTAHQHGPDDTTAYRAAGMLGRFLRDLSDLPAPPLHQTLPGFHDTRARLSNLRRAADTDSVGRAAQTGATLERLFQLAPLANTLERARMPVRIVHNDTKLNNVLFHERSNAALCVVDLDTVMPGLALHDFGDMVRSAATTPDAGRRRLDTGRFEALLGGWLDGLDGLLLETELDLLASAPQVITYELALRYMTDYLEGDHYFKTRAPGQNLERCRQLLCLLDSMREQAAEMERIAARCRSRGA
ncbi:MAG: aminoglycoside phosphotransferase family protein [Candidatus Sedimenticola endophacoides]